MQLLDPQDCEWLLDTGASAHITENTSTLTNLTPYYGTDSVMVGNDTCLRISHIGEGKIDTGMTTLPLKNVLLVPTIKRSLLSVSKLTTDYPCYFEFDCNEFKIKDLKTSRILAFRSKRGGLYVLDGTFIGFRIASEDCMAIWAFFRSVGEEQEKAKEETLEALRIIEEQGLLGEKKFFGGDSIGLADIVLGWIAHMLGMVEEIVGIKLVEPHAFPRLHAWMENFVEHPVIKANLTPRDQVFEHYKQWRENYLASSHQN
ncbi:hypothetical protein HHK36_007687 [Tetracentron sinense]|uniref:glutathione transferase n=1 Tax=Tetracentron sinense TaxID=13715 RepID=A0A834ZS93_TETSI|nr:hypothetical protein HHK36_007687 [Tetracentron sinense]